MKSNQRTREQVAKLRKAIKLHADFFERLRQRMNVTRFGPEDRLFRQVVKTIRAISDTDSILLDLAVDKKPKPPSTPPEDDLPY